MQVPIFRLANTQLVGMSHDEAQELFKQIRIESSARPAAPPSGTCREDIVDNTRLAYNTRSDATGRVPGRRGADGPLLRAGEQRRTAWRCFFNDCAPDMFFYGRWFSEFDFKFVKRFNHHAAA